ncbi:MAG TPA: hypothetical protein VI306_06060 [Pyrinomonadaceae bacterium]
MNKFSDESYFFFFRRGFLTGLASVMDISGSMVQYNASQSGAEADARAIASDWAMIGLDFLNAANSFDEKAEDTTA